MKKNYSMRIASMLLVLVLLTTCVISGTFAKYTTKGESTDTAQVAKFGVTITANGTTFAQEYDGTVVTEEAYKVVAPGTGANLASSTITGSPEVDVKVEYVAELTLTGWVVDSAYYCPLEITVKGTTYKGTTFASATEFEEAVEAAIATYTKTYEANTDLTSVPNLEVSWKWAFEGNDDVKDTALGNQAAAGSAATITLKVTTTVTQVD